MSKHKIHIWKGQEGTMCLRSHLRQGESFVWLSKMNTSSAINVNCKKCLKAYESRQPKMSIELADVNCPNCKALQAERDRLREALKPFIDYFDSPGGVMTSDFIKEALAALGQKGE